MEFARGNLLRKVNRFLPKANIAMDSIFENALNGITKQIENDLCGTDGNKLYMALPNALTCLLPGEYGGNATSDENFRKQCLMPSITILEECVPPFYQGVPTLLLDMMLSGIEAVADWKVKQAMSKKMKNISGICCQIHCS
ncbi:hypothetical protein HHI36_008640 [Cryptolaemus montrouzieri]|uniref:Uncharacterized protein n=1 Tax=Cryptolaemus montrouzieri TaxID=559131 RepID=A0ABD2MTJ5_9CUCU